MNDGARTLPETEKHGESGGAPEEDEGPRPDPEWPNPAKAGSRSEPSDRLNETHEGPDEVERALGDAIAKAAAAGRFDVLPALVAELEARRKARSETIDLAAVRAKRGGPVVTGGTGWELWDAPSAAGIDPFWIAVVVLVYAVPFAALLAAHGRRWLARRRKR